MTLQELPSSVIWPEHWRNVPLWAMFDRVKDVGHPDEAMLSVYREHGVIRKNSREDNTNQTAENRNIYQLVDEGWLIINRMKSWQGSVGVSPFRGIVSGHYLCFRPTHEADSRFLNWLLRSDVYAVEYARMSRGVRPGQIEIDNDELRGLRVALPPLDEQCRIADFLDAETAEIDQLVQARYRQLELIGERDVAETFDAIRGATLDIAMHPSGHGWLGEVADGFRLAAVSHEFEVALGKMLNPTRTQGGHLRPYLRNTNVQWDRIDTSDLLLMDFPPEERARYKLNPGDLLVCEGGEPGRAAIWDGTISDLYYQKALHRVRPRGASCVRWLYYCLRAATYMNVFAVQGNTTTIAHLTGEQLKAQRFPFPERPVQDKLVAMLDERTRDRRSFKAGVDQQLALFAERRQALITAAVTGQIDVTTARGVEL